MQKENVIYHQKQAQVIAIINPSDSSINPTRYTSSMILDPMFLYCEACSSGSANTIFGRWFVIPWKISDKNGLYKELQTIKWCAYTLYQLLLTIL